MNWKPKKMMTTPPTRPRICVKAPTYCPATLDRAVVNMPMSTKTKCEAQDEGGAVQKHLQTDRQSERERPVQTRIDG